MANIPIDGNTDFTILFYVSRDIPTWEATCNEASPVVSSGPVRPVKPVNGLFQKRLESTIKYGTLTVVMADGRGFTCGSGEPHVVWKINQPRTPLKIALDPDFQLGESYLRGEWELPQGTLTELLCVLMRNFDLERNHSPKSVGGRTIRQWNSLRRSLSNIARHYDLEEALFRSFLDHDLHYSCAYFKQPEETLEQAQQNKCQHILEKLCLSPGMRVLDIGCGWGGLARYLTQHGDVEVQGITLSKEQLAVAEQRRAESPMQEMLRFSLQDYRTHQGKYDRIVSVGMFEHVGKPYYPAFFRHLQRLLKESGVALLHTIGRTSGPGNTNPWIARHIFPGGYNPALSELIRALNEVQIHVTDIEVLRRHYALTLMHWGTRFQAHRSRFAQQKGEVFCRMWEFYLAASEACFRTGSLVVYQIQLARDWRQVPETRDYLYS